MIPIGDNVRVRVTPETERAGVAGLEGQIYGSTTPSVTGVEVIGGPESDTAIDVHFESRGESLWFAPSLLEFVDCAPGTEFRLDGVDSKWTRTADGAWVEESTSAEASAPRRRPWWRFW